MLKAIRIAPCLLEEQGLVTTTEQDEVDDMLKALRAVALELSGPKLE